MTKQQFEFDLARNWINPQAAKFAGFIFLGLLIMQALGLL